MPQHNENESAEETTQMYLKLFATLGADVGVGYFASCELRAASCELRVAIFLFHNINDLRS
jgi:hypothetical protein